VLVVEIVLAQVDHRQLPQLREVHRLVEDALTERALAEEADDDAILVEILRRKGSAGSERGAAADDRVRAEVAGLRIGNMHRAAFALAVARLLAQELREHQIRRRPLREAVAVAAMRAGDVVVFPERAADTDRDRLLADVEMSEARHQRAGVEIVDALLEQSNRNHLPVHLDEPIAHRRSPAARASAANIAAKSASASPIARAAVSHSLVVDVVGNGTPSSRPISSASRRSFCIIVVLNHASSGMWRTNGPRYCSIGDPIALCVITSTAVSRAMPLFSASSTPSA